MLAHGAERDLLEPTKKAASDSTVEEAARASSFVRWLADICELASMAGLVPCVFAAQS